MMDFPPLHESAPPFLSMGSQAFSPPQLSLASCLSPDSTIDVDKYRRYTASCLAKAHDWSEAILSTMFGGGESHAASVEKQGNSAFVKLCSSRCVLSRNLVGIARMWIIFYWKNQTHSWLRSWHHKISKDSQHSRLWWHVGATKKGWAVTTEDLNFGQKRQKSAIQKKVKKGEPVTIGLILCHESILHSRIQHHSSVNANLPVHVSSLCV